MAPRGPAWQHLADHVAAHGGTPSVVTEAPTFPEALQAAAHALGTPPDSVAHDAGVHAARAWAAHFQAVLDQYQGRPGHVLALAVEEYLDHITGTGPSGARVTPHLDAAHVRTPRSDLPGAYVAGFLTALVDLSGADATVQPAGPDAWRVAWRLRGNAPAAWWSTYVNPLRLPFLTATLVPVLVALAIAAQHGPLHPPSALLTLVGVALFHLGTNAINEYYNRHEDDRAHVPSTLFGGAATLFPHARVARRRLRLIATTAYAIAALLGLALVATRGTAILWLGLAGFLLGLLYSTPPVRLAHRGLGELAVAVGFGPLIVLGTYYVQRQAWSLEALLASLPLAFLIAAVLYVNQFPDKEGDARVGKRTLIVRLPERAAVIGYVALLALTYLGILLGVALNGIPRLAPYAFPPWSLLALLTLPLAAKASVLLARNYRYPYRLVPANASTILLHLTTGLLFGAGYLLALLP